MSWVGWVITADGFWATEFHEQGSYPNTGHYATAMDRGTGMPVRRWVADPTDAPPEKKTPEKKTTHHTGTSPTGKSTGTTTHHQTAAEARAARQERAQKRADRRAKRLNRLRRSKGQAVDRLEHLKWRYRRARADQHLLRRNLVRRMRQTENRVDTLTRQIRQMIKVRDRNSVRVHQAAQPKFEGQVTVEMLLSTDGVSFSRNVPVRPGHRVYAMVSVTLNQRVWRPGLLAMPHMIKLTWDPPERYRKRQQDKLGSWHNEYIVSNPIVVIREWKAPQTKPTGGVWNVKAELYEIVLDGSAEHAPYFSEDDR